MVVIEIIEVEIEDKEELEELVIDKMIEEIDNKTNMRNRIEIIEEITEKEMKDQ